MREENNKLGRKEGKKIDDGFGGRKEEE